MGTVQQQVCMRIRRQKSPQTTKKNWIVCWFFRTIRFAVSTAKPWGNEKKVEKLLAVGRIAA